MKKGNHRFAVDLATYFQPGKQLSEHMFITGFDGPGGRSTFFCRRRTERLRQDHYGDGGHRLHRRRPGTDVDRRRRHDARRQPGERHLRHRRRRQLGGRSLPDEVPSRGVDRGHLVERAYRRQDGSALGRQRRRAPAQGHNFKGEWGEGKTDANGKPIPISHPNARARCPTRRSEITISSPPRTQRASTSRS